MIIREIAFQMAHMVAEWQDLVFIVIDVAAFHGVMTASLATGQESSYIMRADWSWMRI